MKRGKNIMLLILLLIVLSVSFICFCGCSHAYNNTSSTDGENTLQPSLETESSPSENPGRNNQDSQSSMPAMPVFSENSPWENYDMEGIPEIIDELMEDPEDALILVNKLHAVSPNYCPSDLVYMNNDLTTYDNLELKSEAYAAYLRLYEDAKNQGFTLKVCSAYRTYATQERLYSNSLENRGAALTNVRSAYPGRSEHHTGYALDVTSASMDWGLTQNFIQYPDGQWINEHCAEYGFIIRYPKGKTAITGYAYEPWHLRYVGVEHATKIMDAGITLEEYLGK